jgi:hypothetical protein
MSRNTCAARSSTTPGSAAGRVICRPLGHAAPWRRAVAGTHPRHLGHHRPGLAVDPRPRARPAGHPAHHRRGTARPRRDPTSAGCGCGSASPWSGWSSRRSARMPSTSASSPRRRTAWRHVAADGFPAHPRPVDAHPEHRAARLARLPGHLRRRHHLGVRPVRRADARHQHRADRPRDGLMLWYSPRLPRSCGLFRPAVLPDPPLPRCRRAGLHARAGAGRAAARRDLRGRRRRRDDPRVRHRGAHRGADRRGRRGPSRGRGRCPGAGGRRLHRRPVRLGLDDGDRARRRHRPGCQRAILTLGTAAGLPLPRQPLHHARATGHRDPQRAAERRRRMAAGHRHHRHPRRRR